MLLFICYKKKKLNHSLCGVIKLQRTKVVALLRYFLNKVNFNLYLLIFEWNRAFKHYVTFISYGLCLIKFIVLIFRVKTQY